MSASARRRALASTLLAGAFLGLAGTGIWAYSTPYDATVAGVHTVLGLAVLLAFGVHFTNNLRALAGYLRVRRRLVLAVGTPLALAALVVLGLPPASTLIETGYALRRMGGVEEGAFTVVRTHVDAPAGAHPVTLMVRAGPHYESDPQPLFLGLSYTTVPQMAAWLEDADGRFVDTLYVTRKLSTSGFLATDPFSDEVIRRPEALPVWAHRRGVVHADGLPIPLPGDTGLDGVTAPTPLGHYDVASRAPAGPRRLRVFMEVNRSYDFNAHWHPARFPDDPVYSGSGSSGQPSIVYAADIDLDAGPTRALLRPVGRGHHSGASGVLIPDLEGIDTALGLLGAILVEFDGAPAPDVAPAVANL